MNIKTVAALPFAFIAGVAIALVVSVVAQTSVSAHGDEKHEQKTEAKVAASQEAAYSYVAQPGDSYSKIARKAVQTYGIKNKVDLSQSRIMFAETNLTLEAGSPQLIQGQKVAIKESTIKNWVEKAKKLNNEQAAKWDKYTAGVNFNTNKVGEAQ